MKNHPKNKKQLTTIKKTSNKLIANNVNKSQNKLSQEGSKTDIKQKSILTFLLKIWNNLRFLKIITIISTVITLILGGKDIYLNIDDRLTKNKIIELSRSSGYLPLLSNESLMKWKKDMESLKAKNNYRDAYYMLKAAYLSQVDVSILSSDLTPDYYFERISIESGYFNSSIMGRIAYFSKIKDTAIQTKKYQRLIERLNDLLYINPTFFFVKYSYAVNALGNPDTLLSYYNEFRRYYPSVSRMDTVTANENELIVFDIQNLIQVSALDYLFTTSLYTMSDEIGVKNKCKDHLFQLSNCSDGELLGLKDGMDSFGIIYPFCPFESYLHCYESKYEWLIFQREIIRKLIDGRYKILPT